MNRPIFYSLVLGTLLALMAIQTSFGQRHRKGEYAFSLQTGILDRIPTRADGKADNQGYLASLDFVRYTKAEHYWKVGYQYDRKYYRPFGDILVSERHTIGVDYAPVSLHNYRRSYYLSPVIGLFTGLEIVNRDQRELPQGHIGAQTNFTFGGSIGLEAEVFLSQHLSLVGGLTERYYAVSDLSKLHTQAQLGLRLTLFN